ncbi:2' O-ribose methyltransferase [Coemansia guatemalensis]|uniref:rRNA methyltransferase 2, mitochondrial n=1 Tax=Coemansia guatemalensis TaxID=2761395 RepID=A0A9W8LRF8_9FUNG|nr:2' O-ribose methyltransferase [Coemansia guatemalensis]
MSSKKGGSSHRYLQRQQRDPFVKQAAGEQYRARSSYKLIEMLDKHRQLLPQHSSNSCVIDCGAAPGGWSQVVARRLQKTNNTEKGRVIAVDLLPMRAIPGVQIVQGNFLDSDIKQKVAEAVDGRPVGLMLSDMAPSFTGHRSVDAARTMALCEDVVDFADEWLADGGGLVLKYFMGGEEKELRDTLRAKFDRVIIEKPLASRKQSAENYMICLGKEHNNNC